MANVVGDDCKRSRDENKVTGHQNISFHRGISSAVTDIAAVASDSD